MVNACVVLHNWLEEWRGRRLQQWAQDPALAAGCPPGEFEPYDIEEMDILRKAHQKAGRGHRLPFDQGTGHQMVSIIDKHATGDQLMRVPVTPRLDTSTKSGEVEDFDADVDAQEDADVDADEAEEEEREEGGGKEGEEEKQKQKLSERQKHMKKRNALVQPLHFLRKNKTLRWVPFRHGALSNDQFKDFTSRVAAKWNLNRS